MEARTIRPTEATRAANHVRAPIDGERSRVGTDGVAAAPGQNLEAPGPGTGGLAGGRPAAAR